MRKSGMLRTSSYSVKGDAQQLNEVNASDGGMLQSPEDIDKQYDKSQNQQNNSNTPQNNKNPKGSGSKALFWIFLVSGIIFFLFTHLHSCQAELYAANKKKDLFEKVFIIKRVEGFSRNLRKEIRKTCRYYFWDNGIRNALINNFNYPEHRDDIGMLWENFIFTERLKRNTYRRHYANYYFWRTYSRQEIDFVEEYGGKLAGYEFKWRPTTKKAPKVWLETYPNASFTIVHNENFWDFVT